MIEGRDKKGRFVIKFPLDKNELKKLYFKDWMSSEKIGKLLGMSGSTMRWWLRRYKIRRRKHSEWVKGERHPFYGKHHTFGAKRKISLANNGKHLSPRTEFKKGSIPWNKGKKITPHRHYWFKLGPLNPYWKGGRSSFRGSGWNKIREQVWKRDNYRCKICGAEENGEHHIAHHIVPYSQTKDNLLDNLITLCRPCHQKVERGVTQLEGLMV